MDSTCTMSEMQITLARCRYLSSYDSQIEFVNLWVGPTTEAHLLFDGGSSVEDLLSNHVPQDSSQVGLLLSSWRRFHGCHSWCHYRGLQGFCCLNWDTGTLLLSPICIICRVRVTLSKRRLCCVNGVVGGYRPDPVAFLKPTKSAHGKLSLPPSFLIVTPMSPGISQLARGGCGV